MRRFVARLKAAHTPECASAKTMSFAATISTMRLRRFKKGSCRCLCPSGSCVSNSCAIPTLRKRSSQLEREKPGQDGPARAPASSRRSSLAAELPARAQSRCRLPSNRPTPRPPGGPILLSPRPITPSAHASGRKPVLLAVTRCGPGLARITCGRCPLLLPALPAAWPLRSACLPMLPAAAATRSPPVASSFPAPNAPPPPTEPHK
mmetsp:Transcript_482/g.1402  ORF Transcript_482/g.1402 Transcript_482/m.1402 type:complete len:206 (-) Transcript_482:37-654(-)